MRKFIEDLKLLWERGELSVEKTSYSNSSIPSLESPGTTYYVLKNKGDCFAYVKCGFLKYEIIHKWTSQRIWLSRKEFLAIHELSKNISKINSLEQAINTMVENSNSEIMKKK